MFALSTRKFHNLLIAPVLFPLLMLVGTRMTDNHAPVAADDAYTVVVANHPSECPCNKRTNLISTMCAGYSEK
jgi:hypothetical protein